jgi:hypothetical protein
MIKAMVKTSIGSILLLILPKPKVSMIAAVQHSKCGICLLFKCHEGQPADACNNAEMPHRCAHLNAPTSVGLESCR